MKKYLNKQTVTAFLFGIILCTSIPAAAAALNIIPNPFPVIINGNETPVEGYNIDGFTYLKLADIKKAGLTVKFNETDKQIEITSAESSTAALSVQQNNISGGSNMLIEYNSKTGMPVGAITTTYKDCATAVLYNGNTYLSKYDLSKYFSVKYKHTNVQDDSTTYGTDTKDFTINLNDSSSCFFNQQGTPYFNVNVFQF